MHRDPPAAPARTALEVDARIEAVVHQAAVRRGDDPLHTEVWTDVRHSRLRVNVIAAFSIKTADADLGHEAVVGAERVGEIAYAGEKVVGVLVARGIDAQRVASRGGGRTAHQQLPDHAIAVIRLVEKIWSKDAIVSAVAFADRGQESDERSSDRPPHASDPRQRPVAARDGA